jgi:hypothetical protein
LPLIQPFRLGDTFLIQRLGRQATNLNAVQALLQPRTPASAALTAVIPWGDAKVATFVLKQPGHRLIRAGFIQVQKRPRRPEYDINLLAPALDTPSGHPAIWEKLLSYTITEASQHKIERIYVDVPDQPLLVNSFAHVGFSTYARQTIWRLRDHGFDGPGFEAVNDRGTATIRPAVAEDEWALQRLYAQVTPGPVQQAECGHEDSKAPILYEGGAGGCSRYVLVEEGEINGALHLLRGERGTWLSVWADTLQVDDHYSRQLLCFGLRTVQTDSLQIPVYVGVSDYHGGLSALLNELGFAPFTDRARMVKRIVARVKEGTTAPIPALESIGKVATTPYISHHEISHDEISYREISHAVRCQPRHSTNGHNEPVGKPKKYAGTSTR